MLEQPLHRHLVALGVEGLELAEDVGVQRKRLGRRQGEHFLAENGVSVRIAP